MRLLSIGILVYLFVIPDGWLGTWPVAPESIGMAGWVYAAVLGDIGLRRGVTTRDAVRAVPLPIWLLLLLMVAIRLCHAPTQWMLILRPVLWANALLFGVLISRSTLGAAVIRRIWMAVACGAAAIYLSLPSKWELPAANVFAFEHRTMLGYFLAAGLVLLVAASRRPLAPLKWLAAGALAAALLITRARGAWLLAVMALAVREWQAGRRRVAVVGTCAAVAVVLIVPIATQGEIGSRLRSIWDLRVGSSSLYRIDLYLAAAKAVPEVGLLGAGPGSSPRVLQDRTFQRYEHIAAASRGERNFSTDSDVIQIGIENGLLGVVLLLWGLGILGKHAIRRDRGIQILGLAVWCTLIALILFDNVLSVPFGWVLAGVAAALLTGSTIDTPSRAAARV